MQNKRQNDHIVQKTFIKQTSENGFEISFSLLKTSCFCQFSCEHVVHENDTFCNALQIKTFENVTVCMYTFCDSCRGRFETRF